MRYKAESLHAKVTDASFETSKWNKYGLNVNFMCVYSLPANMEIHVSLSNVGFIFSKICAWSFYLIKYQLVAPWLGGKID